MTILRWVRKLLSSTSLRPPRAAQESQSRQQGSLAEFEHVNERQSRELYSFCLETVGDRAETEKLVQVAFLSLFCAVLKRGTARDREVRPPAIRVADGKRHKRDRCAKFLGMELLLNEFLNSNIGLAIVDEHLRYQALNAFLLHQIFASYGDPANNLQE
jgi:hypothetical protein